MKKYMSLYPEVSLIVIGIALPIESLTELNELSKMSKEGFFIESIESEDLDIAFQSLTNLIFGM